MSRSGYSDDGDDVLALGRWRAQVHSAIRGKRGQLFLRDLISALDAMPEKELIANDLVDNSGCVCALGALGKKRSVDLDTIDTHDYDTLGSVFDIAHQLAQEVMWENDECFDQWDFIEIEICGPVRRGHPDWGSHKRNVRVPMARAAEKRWQHMRNWAVENLSSHTEAADKP